MLFKFPSTYFISTPCKLFKKLNSVSDSAFSITENYKITEINPSYFFINILAPPRSTDDWTASLTLVHSLLLIFLVGHREPHSKFGSCSPGVN